MMMFALEMIILASEIIMFALEIVMLGSEMAMFTSEIIMFPKRILPFRRKEISAFVFTFPVAPVVEEGCFSINIPLRWSVCLGLKQRLR